MLSDIEIGHGGEARCGHHHGADASTLIIGAGLRYKSVLHMVRSGHQWHVLAVYTYTG